MPILHIEIVGEASHYREDLAQSLADAAGKALNSRPQGTWIKLHFLPPANYAENGGAIDGNPMIVSVLQAEPPAGEALSIQTHSLAEAIADTSGHRLENVHIIIEPAANGRIAFGGDLG